MKIEIDLPESVITSAVVAGWRRSFGQGDGTGNSDGLLLVRAVVADTVQSPATREAIVRWVGEVVTQLGPTIVREEVRNRMRAMVKQVVKEEQETLFPKGK